MSSLKPLAVALRSLGVDIRIDVSLAAHTTFRVGGPASILAEPSDEQQLLGVLRASADHGIPVLVLGRGSNLLVSDRGFTGVAVKLGRRFGQIEVRGGDLVAGGAATLPQVANRAARAGLGGLEFCVAIPGSVGGGVRMNAGAHGCAVGDVLTWARVVDGSHPAPFVLQAQEIGFDYRRSSIGPDTVVVQAAFRPTPADPRVIQERMQSFRDHRAATQPIDAPNAGSMFANPPGDFAGRLIEEVGAKGMFVGRAQVSNKHANFFLAHEPATAQDVYDLMAKVQSMVAEATGIVLRAEVRVVGEFEAPTGRRLIV